MLIFVISCLQRGDGIYNHRISLVFAFPKTVICYLLFVIVTLELQMVFGNCQLSTVTLELSDLSLQTSALIKILTYFMAL